MIPADWHNEPNSLAVDIPDLNRQFGMPNPRPIIRQSSFRLIIGSLMTAMRRTRSGKWFKVLSYVELYERDLAKILATFHLNRSTGGNYIEANWQFG